MKIGVAIPCFIKHIDKCLELLDSMNNQTRLPDQVVVSCSSIKQGAFPEKNYNFPVKIITTEEQKNASKNRNIAAKALETDIITFFDADDSMHNQRLEIIERAFEMGADIVLHSFLFAYECQHALPKIEQFDIRSNVLSQCRSGCITYDRIQRITHGHVSVTHRIYQMIQFPEEPIYETREDCVFCYCVFSIPDITSCYIAHPLTKYMPSGTCNSESGKP
jgi:glycosyltransferase involved in cell wall biosynthesis